MTEWEFFRALVSHAAGDPRQRGFSR
jgi:hypothetical protein